MPELPEVETVCRTLQHHLVNQHFTSVVVYNACLRQPVDHHALKLLCGRMITTIHRRGKYLLFAFKDAGTLLIHLGMSGRLLLQPQDQPLQRHDHVVFALPQRLTLRFNDPRRFGLIQWLKDGQQQCCKQLCSLGVEPLDSTAFHPAYLARWLQRSQRSIKTVLMDNRCVVGIGNIYSNESLFAAKIHPQRLAAGLTAQEIKKLYHAIKQTLHQAIAKGGTTLRNFSDAAGLRGLFTPELKVYGRERMPCIQCQTAILKIVLTGRSTFFCPRCQRLPMLV